MFIEFVCLRMLLSLSPRAYHTNSLLFFSLVTRDFDLNDFYSVAKGWNHQSRAFKFNYITTLIEDVLFRT